MSEAEYYWPETPGVYEVCDSRGQPDRLTFDGQYWTRSGVANSYSSECLERNFFYLGVRREQANPQPTDQEKFAAFLKRAAAEVESWPEWMQDTLGWWREDAEISDAKPTPKTITPDPDDGNAMVAQEALDEWRACKQQPKAADWAYRWAVDLCEKLGAR